MLPAFTDAHVHFPTWSLARSEVALDGLESLPEALVADRIPPAPDGRMAPRHGWRDAACGPSTRRGQALDDVTGETPAALWSKDYHSLWLNSAGPRARRAGSSTVPGGVVERDADGEPTGILREEAAWRFRERYVTVSEDEWVAATRDGIRVANARGVGAIHDKDGWLGAQSIFARIHEQRRAHAARLAVAAARARDGAARDLRLRSRPRSTTTCGSAT